MAKQPKKEIVQIDGSYQCPIVAYNYTDKKEAYKDILEQLQMTKEDIRYRDLVKVRVRRFVKPDGDLWYDWCNSCQQCGRKSTEGVISFIVDC